MERNLGHSSGTTEQIIMKIFLTILSLFFVENLAQISPEIELKIEELIEEVRTAQNIPGLGLSITKSGSLSSFDYSKGFGLQNIEDAVNVHENTIFAIGSVSKSFTAFIVIRVLSTMFPDLGEAVLDVPIQQLAPDYGFILGDRYRTDETTFRDLLAHRLCTLPDYMGIFIGAFENSDDLLFRQRFAPELCSIRNGYWYNNALIGMAGDVVGHITNSTFTDLLTHFLADIGMTSTTWIKDSDNHNEMINRSIPYLWKDDAFLRYNADILKIVEIAPGAGGVLSSPSDMLKYMKMFLNGGNVDGVQIIPSETIGWLTKLNTPSFFGTFKTEENPLGPLSIYAGYGLCLTLGSYDGYLRIDHGGYIPPYASLLTFFPDLGLGIFTTTSGPGELQGQEVSHERLHEKIFDIIQGIERPSAQKPNTNPSFTPSNTKFLRNLGSLNPPKAKEIVLPPDQMVGAFDSGLNGKVEISLKTNSSGQVQPYINYGVWGQGWLTLEDDESSRYLITWESDYWMTNWASLVDPPPQNFIMFVSNDGLVMGDTYGGRSTDEYRRLL